MARCVGVVFSPGGKVQRYAAGELELRWNDHVVCQTPKGEELGRVVLAPHDWAPEGGSPPAPVLRAATAADERAKHEHDDAAAALLKHLRELLRRDASPASAVRCDISLDGTRASVWYRAEERVELRGVAGELEPALGPPRRAAPGAPARGREAVRGRRPVRPRQVLQPLSRRTSSRSRCAWRRTRSCR